MDQAKQSTKSDCQEQNNSPPGGVTCSSAVEGGAYGGTYRPPGGGTVEQPAGRAEAQHCTDSTLSNLSVSKTRAEGGITRGVLDNDPHGHKTRSKGQIIGSRRHRIDNMEEETDALWSSVESAMLNCHGNVKTRLSLDGVDPAGNVEGEGAVWGKIQSTG